MTLEHFAQMRWATWPISSTVACSSARDRAGGIAPSGDLGDVQREVTHPLDVGDHAQARDDDAQVAGDRLLAGEQVERVGLDLLVELVDRRVAGDHRLGGLQVGVEQRLGRVVDGASRQPGDVDERRRDRVEILVVLVAHSASRCSVVEPSSASVPITVSRRW